MPNIRPISDLRNYSSVLDSVTTGTPVYLTKNGRGCYTIMDMQEQEQQQKKAQEYDHMKAQLMLMCELNIGRKSGEDEGWISAMDVRNHFAGKVNER